MRDIVVSTMGEVIDGGLTASADNRFGLLLPPVTWGPGDTDGTLLRQNYANVFAFLDEDEQAFVLLVWDRQSVNNDRFRVWGRNGRMRLTTEFIVPKDGQAELRALAKQTAAHYEVMFEMDEPPENPNSVQVGLDWDITDLRRWQLDAKLVELRGLTQNLWESAGVSVI